MQGSNCPRCSHNTAKAWLSVLEASYLVMQLPAWHRNVNKRIIRRPKLHFVDTGLACALLGIKNREQLATHPLRGAIFESFVALEIHKSRVHRGRHSDLHHYRETRGAEIDLLSPGHPRGLVVESKAGRTMQQDFLKHLDSFSADEWDRFLVYGGDQRQTRSGVQVLPWRALAEAEW